MKKIVFRKDDYIRIKNPIIVERVGYPLNIQKVKDEHFSIEEKQKIEEFLRFFKVTSSDIFEVKPEKTRSAIIHALAMNKIQQLRWGGNERSLHLRTDESLRDKEVWIVKKKIVKIGTRFAASGYYGYDGEYNFEPGRLDNMKTHVLLGFWSLADSIFHFNTDNDLVWIEEKNVELVNQYEPKSNT